MVPEYFSLLAEVFIGLAAVAGIVITLQGVEGNELMKTRAVNLLLYAFAGCGYALAPHVLSDLGFSIEAVWTTLSAIAVVVMSYASFLAFHQWRTIYRPAGIAGGFAKTVAVCWALIAAANAVNVAGWPLATGAHIIGASLWVLFCVAGALFVRVVIRHGIDRV